MPENNLLSKSKRRMLSTLSSRKMRVRHGLFVVEGSKSVADLVAYGGMFDIEFLVALESGLEEALAAADKASCTERGKSAVVPVFVASDSDMRDISSLSTTPDVLAVCRMPERVREDVILSEPLAEDLYLMLDGVQDPGNLGTIIRTAHWMGIKRIFASKTTVDIFNPKTVQSTMGSLASVRVDYVDLPALAEANRHIPVAGLLLDGEDIYNVSLPASAFIVMGNEGSGITSGMRRITDIALTIPPYDPCNHSESLNVAVATAITLSQFRHPKFT